MKVKSKKVIIKLLCFIISPVYGLESVSVDFINYTAVSQTGGFSVTYFSPVVIDKELTDKLTNFIAYKSPSLGTHIMIGPIFSDKELQQVCKNPDFLQVENISAMSLINDEDIFNFDIEQFKGCVVNYSLEQSALIVEIPESFRIYKYGNIKYIGIIERKNEVKKLIFNISFSLSAEEVFVNILEIVKAYSLLEDQIDWNEKYNQGVDFIGFEIKQDVGRLAARQYLVNELNIPSLYPRFNWILSDLNINKMV